MNRIKNPPYKKRVFNPRIKYLIQIFNLVSKIKINVPINIIKKALGMKNILYNIRKQSNFESLKEVMVK